MQKNSKMYNILFKKGAAYIFTGSFFTKFVSLFGSIFVIRLLTKEQYGILGYLENIYSYAYLLCGLGLANAVLRFIILGRNIEEKNSYFRFIIKKGTIINLLIVVIFIIVNNVYPHPQQYHSFIPLLNILILALPFQYIVDVTLLNERALFNNKNFAYMSFSVSLILILGRIIGGNKYELTGIIFCRVIINMLFAILLLYYSNKHHYKNVKCLHITKNSKSEIYNYSLQYMITNGLWIFFMLNDTFLLGLLCPDPSILAEYKVAYVLPGNVSLISSAIGTFICPYFVKHESDSKWIRKNFLNVYMLTALLVGALCLILGIMARPLIRLIFGYQYENTVSLMRLLLISAFFNCGLRFTVANILASMGQIKFNMLISSIGVFFQIALDILLIPKYGALGVAFTSIIVYFFMAIALLILFIKKYYANYK